MQLGVLPTQISEFLMGALSWTLGLRTPQQFAGLGFQRFACEAKQVCNVMLRLEEI
jgi:hypothetical protein